MQIFPSVLTSKVVYRESIYQENMNIEIDFRDELY
jgi:hypothetical protein